MANYLNLIDIEKVKPIVANATGLPFTDRFGIMMYGVPGAGADKLAFQALSVETPNFSIDPTELELNGARRFVFKGRTDSELSVTFLETPDLKFRKVFYDWMERAIKISETNGVQRNYMDDYMPKNSECYIFPLDIKGNAVLADKFTHLCPYDISGISYNYSQSGEIIKTTIKFKYMYHTLETAR